MIDGHLTEINVTSPTGLRAIKRLGGPDLAAAIWDAIEAKRAARPQAWSSPTPAGRLARRALPVVEAPADGQRFDPKSSLRPPAPRGLRAKARRRATAPRRRNCGLARHDRQRRRVPAGGESQSFAGALEEGRAEARRQLEDGGKGLACARADQPSRGRNHPRPFTGSRCGSSARRIGAGRARLTIAAVGGYGRGLLAPGSDIDLLFLLPDERTPEADKIVETMLYVLWDLRQKVGHATRSIDECLRQASADMTIRTALLEARLHPRRRSAVREVAGAVRQGDRRQDGAANSSPPSSPNATRASKRAGESRYLVEPNVKEGKGGLRDLNTLFWIAKYVYRVRDPRDLVAAGLFTQREFSLFRRCEEFLWAVRCHLHFITGRAEERLSFDLQRPIAERLGYARARRPERRRALHEALFPDRQGRRRSHRDRLRGARGAAGQAAPGARPVLRPAAPPTAASIADAKDFKIDFDRINVVRGDAFERDPVNLIRLFWVADRTILRHPSRRDAARHPVAEADRRQLARRSRSQPPFPRKS